jgi:hypothetical protein
MSITLQWAETHVARLIAQANEGLFDGSGVPWAYEITSEVDNIGIIANESSRTLRVNPAWLRFVVESGDFKVCVADEIMAWYLLQKLTASA